MEPSGVVLDDATVQTMCEKTGLPPDQEHIAALKRIVGRQYDFGDFALTSENNFLLNRFNVGGRSPLKSQHTDTPVNRDIVYSIERHYLPASLRPGEESSWNVRIANRGKSIISSRGHPPVHFAYHWRRPDGSMLVADGIRTRLLIDLLPGQALTMPMRFLTPDERGPLILDLQLVHEQVAWLETGAVQHTVVMDPNTPDLAAGWISTGINRGGYVEDHYAGLALIQEELGPNPPADLTVLEVAGTSAPMAAKLPGTIHNVDIDIQCLQLGNLLSALWRRPVQHVCADALNLPFRDGSFDWVTIFAALHHFADPAAVLAEMRRIIRPGGRIAVMSEPMGHDMETEEIIGQLEHGINEQIFSLPEYAAIFARAGLTVHRLQIDIGSFKVILKAT